MGYIWTEDEIHAVSEMSKANVTVEMMREVLPRRSAKSISCKIYELGLVPRSKQDVDWDRLQEILKSSKPVEL